MSVIQSHERGATVALYVQPRASRTEIAGLHGDALRIRVAAPPVDGAANSEIINWLSKVLGIAKRDVVLLAGERGRRKMVLVEGVGVGELEKALGLS